MAKGNGLGVGTGPWRDITFRLVEYLDGANWKEHQATAHK